MKGGNLDFEVNDKRDMPAFSSTPLNEGSLNRKFRRNPALFGIPFVLLIVGASFAMTTFTQTKYDLQASRQASVSRSGLGW